RDFHVTGVQTCALPIWRAGGTPSERSGANVSFVICPAHTRSHSAAVTSARGACAAVSSATRNDAPEVCRWSRIRSWTAVDDETEIGRAACRERGEARAE